ncbi:MAG: hypothetical protein WBW16_14140 [Bacteroidota bacterium]
MQHIDQHILELYVLNAASVKSRLTEIEDHLAECAGCRGLVDQMTESYRAVQEKFIELESSGEISEKSLAPGRLRLIVPRRPEAMPSVSYRPVTNVQRFQYFVRQHPVITVGGSFAAFAALALLATLMFKSSAIKDTNPAYVRYNEGSNSAEILNKESQLLWLIPSRNIPLIVHDEAWFGTPYVVVDDIDGDGKNEVLTTLWHPGDGLSRDAPFLRVYDYRNNLRFKTSFVEPIKYLERQYSDTWTAERVITVEGGVSGEKDIFVTWSCGRSPTVITRFDARGKELGQYWHFGVFPGMFAVDANGDGTRELILTGENDTLDSLRQEFPAVAVLDPKRIVGTKKSAASPGFALQASDAEIYYLRLPVSPMSATLAKHEGVHHLIQNRDGTLEFWIGNATTSADPDRADYEYRFSRNLQVLDVKSTDVTDRLYARKAREGLVKGRIDAAYLSALKNGVRYWDGREWRREAVKVQHQAVTMK